MSFKKKSRRQRSRSTSGRAQPADLSFELHLRHKRSVPRMLCGAVLIWVDLKGVLGLIAIQPFWGLFLFVGILVFAGGLILPGLMRRPAVDIQNGHVRFKTLLRTYEFDAGRPPAFFYPLTVYFYTVLMMKVRKGNGYKGFAEQIHNMRHLNGDEPDPEALQMDMMGVKRLDEDDREMFAYAERYRGFIGSIRAMGWALWLILIMAIAALILRELGVG